MITLFIPVKPSMPLVYKTSIRYLLLVLTLLLNIFLFHCKPRLPQDSKRILKTFISARKKQSLRRSEIKPLLYEFQSENNTVGRATHIGGSLFLTAFHVVELAIEPMQLIPQNLRGKLKDINVNYKVIAYNRALDLALLHCPSLAKPKKTLVTLLPETIILTTNLKSENILSEFLLLSANTVKHKSYLLAFGGQDYYTPSIHHEFMGRFVFPQNSSLFEIEGKQLPYFPKKIFTISHKDDAQLNDTEREEQKKLHERIHAQSKHKLFTSVSAYDGESGSAYFLKKDDTYTFIGLLSASYSTKERIETPNHPLGFTAYDRTNTVIVGPTGIRTFIAKFIRKELD